MFLFQAVLKRQGMSFFVETYGERQFLYVLAIMYYLTIEQKLLLKYSFIM